MKKIPCALFSIPLLFSCSPSSAGAQANDLVTFFEHLGDANFSYEVLENQLSIGSRFTQVSFFGKEGNLVHSYLVSDGQNKTVSAKGMIKIPDYGYFTFDLAKDSNPALEGDLCVGYMMTPKQDLNWYEQRSSFATIKSFFDEKEAFKAAFSPKEGEERVYQVTDFEPYTASFRCLAEMNGHTLGKVYDATLRVEKGGGKGTFSISHEYSYTDFSGGEAKVVRSTFDVSFFDFGKAAIPQFEKYLSSSSRPTPPSSWKEDKRLDKVKGCEGLSDALPFYDKFTYGYLSVLFGVNNGYAFHFMDLLLKQEHLDSYASLLIDAGWEKQTREGGTKSAEINYVTDDFAAVLSFPTTCMEDNLLDEAFAKDGYFSLFVSPRTGIFA